MWESPIINFIEIFTQLKKSGIITIRILFDNELVNNQNVPADYLVTWMLISTPIFIITFLGWLLVMAVNYIFNKKATVWNKAEKD